MPEPMRAGAGEARIRIDDDLVGFFFPVYMHSLPGIVADFASRLDFGGRPYAFAVATHNGGPGTANGRLGDILAKSGIELSAGFELLMPGSSVILKDFTNPPEERNRRLAEAEASLESIAEAVRARRMRPARRREAIGKRAEAAVTAAAMRLYRLPRHFRGDENCVKCGACARVCPRANVSVGAGVSWGDDCERCLACFHWCPKKAIQIDAYTSGSLRYHHPLIGLEEIAGSR